MSALTSSKTSQFLHVGSLGYTEHCSQLSQHPIPNRSTVKKPGTDSTFESVMNFKRGLVLPEKSDKFSKNPS
jgi:hypothetical protein